MHAICDTNGVVQRLVSAPAHMLTMQLMPDESLHELHGDDANFASDQPCRIVDGRLVPLKEET